MADPTVFSYTLRDQLGTEASTLIYVDYDGAVETENALAGSWAAYGAALDAASGAQIIKGHILIPQNADGAWKTSPAAGSRVEQNAIINFRATGSSKRQGFSVPALLNTLISSDGKVNTTSGALHDLIALILGGFGTVDAANALGTLIVAFTDAFLAFRKHRKQLEKSTEVFTE